MPLYSDGGLSLFPEPHLSVLERWSIPSFVGMLGSAMLYLKLVLLLALIVCQFMCDLQAVLVLTNVPTGVSTNVWIWLICGTCWLQTCPQGYPHMCPQVCGFLHVWDLPAAIVSIIVPPAVSLVEMLFDKGGCRQDTVRFPPAEGCLLEVFCFPTCSY